MIEIALAVSVCALAWWDVERRNRIDRAVAASVESASDESAKLAKEALERVAELERRIENVNAKVEQRSALRSAFRK